MNKNHSFSCANLKNSFSLDIIRTPPPVAPRGLHFVWYQFDSLSALYFNFYHPHWNEILVWSSNISNRTLKWPWRSSIKYLVLYKGLMERPLMINFKYFSFIFSSVCKFNSKLNLLQWKCQNINWETRVSLFYPKSTNISQMFCMQQ